MKKLKIKKVVKIKHVKTNSVDILCKNTLHTFNFHTVD